jgi:signal transduction histidine kinase/CheY-like chemotaxis protein/HPt (histidine-containing phosphotransfer) domain-containing protein
MTEFENKQIQTSELKLYRSLLFVTMFLYPIFGLVDMYIIPMAHEDGVILAQRIGFSTLILIMLIGSYFIQKIQRSFYLVICVFIYLGYSHLLWIALSKGFYLEHITGMLMTFVGTSLVFRRHAHLNFYLLYVLISTSFVAWTAPKLEFSPVVIMLIFISIIMVVFIGMNAKIKAQINLRHNEANIYALTENTEDMIWSVNHLLEFLTLNSNVKRMFERYGLQVKIGDCFDKIALPENVKLFWLGLLERGLKGESFKVTHTNSDNGLVYEHSFYPIRNRRGDVKGTCVYSKDITALTNREKELNEAQKIAKIGSFRKNFLTGKYIWSDYMYELFQLPKDIDLSAFDMSQCLHPDDYEKYKGVFEENIKTKSNFTLRYRIIRFNKTELNVLSTISIEKNEKGELLKLNGTIQDISELSKAEQLEKENNLLQKEKEVIELAAKQQEKFVANMSHEIRTPMNSIVGVTNLLTDASNLTDKQREYLKAIRLNSKNLLRIINDILEFSNINKGSIEIHQMDFNIHDLLNSSLESISEKVKEKNIELSTYLDDTLPLNLRGDVIRCSQILISLLINSLKYTNQGKIILSAEKSLTKSSDDFQWVQFKVIDTGVGIPESRIERAFEPFYQVETEDKFKNAGTGLGLAIVKKIVDALGGEIKLNSWEGIGTEVIVQIPFSNVSEIDVMKENDLPALKILLVEDNSFNQMVAEDTLKAWNENLVIDIAENGLEGVEKLKMNDYDVVLMDIQMPIMDGHEATIAIRTTLDEPKKSIPIIAVTAHAFKEEIENCFKNGMNDYISKPYEGEDLINKILNAVNYQASKTSTNIVEDVVHQIEISKTVDTQVILDFTKGKKDRIEKMILMFLEETPVELDKMNQLFLDNNFAQLKTLAHSFKPKFTYLGMPQFSEIAKKIEHLSVDPANKDEINELIIQLLNDVNDAYLELKEFLDSL